MMADKPERNCFVVGPIGAADSEVRVHADWLLEEIINPVMADFTEFVVHRADKLSQPGLIDTQVITHLLNDDLVIADITTLNPNAFYEIGIRHMAQKPIIHMHKAGEKIPFDISAYRSIEFSLSKPADLRSARINLRAVVEAVMADGFKVDNPVTHARGVVHIQEQATDDQRVLLDEIKGLKDRLSKLESLENLEKDLLSNFKISVDDRTNTAKSGVKRNLVFLKKGADVGAGESSLEEILRRALGSDGNYDEIVGQFKEALLAKSEKG
jgi:hypothetical protein